MKTNVRPSDGVNEIIQLIESMSGEYAVSKREGQCLYYLAKNRCGKGVIVEIGSWKGISTIWLAKGSLAGSKSKVYAIDPHKKTSAHIPLKTEDDTYPIFSRNMRRAQVDKVIVPLVMTSDEAIKEWRQPILLLWIDGSHEYKDVKNDFLHYEPYLEPSGIIAFHDCWELSVNKVIREEVLKSKRFSKLGSVERIFFAEKTNTSSFRDKQIRQRFELLLMSYVYSLTDFLTKPKALKPFRRLLLHFRGLFARIVAVGMKKE